MPSASSQAVLFLDSRLGGKEAPNVVLIVVESWGLALDSHLAQELTAPYNDPRIAGKYDVSYGAVPFSGNTVPAEVRELCQSTMGFGILYASAGAAEKCLPASFHSRGYQNLAVHGYAGGMFDRSEWYPILGFDRTWFGPDLAKIGLPNCRGAFPGICDASIAAWLGSSFLIEDQGKPKFIYWMTLNSHLPVPSNPDLPDDGVCAAEPELRNSEALCSWFRLVRAVHQSVQQVALGPTARPTVFVLVGDHAPPFADPRLRADFSGTQVPYVILTPLPESTR
jgi:phosphoglycerol transferase MdoB-like AlkP superfamily enzyme